MSSTEAKAVGPVAVFTLGAVTAKVWRNVGEGEDQVPRYSTGIVRTFYDKKREEFRETPTYSVEHLPLVESVSRKAFEDIHQRISADRKTRRSEQASS